MSFDEPREDELDSWDAMWDEIEFDEWLDSLEDEVEEGEET